MAQKHNSFWLYFMWGLLALVLVGWTAWWFVLQSQVVAQIDKWMATQRVAGAEVSYARVAGSGYPLRLTLTFDDFSYQAPGQAWRASTPKVQLHINPSDLSLFIVEPRDTISYASRGAARTFTPRESAISVHVTNNAVDRVVAEGKGVAVTRDGAPDMTIGSFVAGVRPDPRAPGDGQFTLDSQAIDWATPPKGFEAFGKQVQTLNARIVFEKGATLIGPGDDRIGAWKDAQGAARVEGLGFVWGPATVTSTGRFELDAQRRLDGILDISLDKPGGVFSALAQSASPDMAQIYQLMAVANEARGGPLEAPLVIDNGVMMFNNLPIRTVDPIK